jgi:hypothetical protein
MPSYRAYPVSKNRQVAAAPSVAIVCENEQDGLRQAQQLVDDFDIELWDGPRFIARLKSPQEPKGSN